MVSECRVFIVSGIPEKLMDFGSEQSKKESLMLMQCLSEYSLKCDFIKIDEEIEHHNKYRLAFSTQAITADSFNHYEKKFVELENVQMQLIIPYSMSLRESLQQMKFIFRISSASINIVVADFEHFFQLVVRITALSARSSSTSTAPSSHRLPPTRRRCASTSAASGPTSGKSSRLSSTTQRPRSTSRTSATPTLSWSSSASRNTLSRSR